MKFEHLKDLVVEWAGLKGILIKGTPMRQGLKTLEEVNELLTAIDENNKEEIADAIGDVLVTIIIQAELQGMRIEECLEGAYNVIKGRKGQMINGTFVKEV